VHRRTFARIATVLAALALLAACGAREGSSGDDAAAFPSEPIRLLVPYAAGGPTDLTARAYGESLEQQLG
jgi:tripartite-type tricarboxylate transporter receptor subunit TctC